MSNALQYSMFSRVLFPPAMPASQEEGELFFLRRVFQRALDPKQIVEDLPIVVFDFETTGLDTSHDRIIEIGAIKLSKFEPVKEYWTFVKPDIPLPSTIQKITGITADMLADQPPLSEVIDDFLAFVDGCILVAHNAEYDYRIFKSNASRLGYDFDWPCFCTFKMSKELLPNLERRNLDTLAQHFGLTFEARHRSIGDAKVTAAVLAKMWQGFLKPANTWQELSNYWVV